MHNALVRMTEVVKFDSEFLAVISQCFNLVAGEGLFDGQVLIFGGNVMVGSGGGTIDVEHLDASLAKTVECLGTRDFVDEVSVDEDGVGITRDSFDDVPVPNLFKNCFCL